eukprot:gene3225-biopygen3169
MTGTSLTTMFGWTSSLTKVHARMLSRSVTPRSLFLSYFPAAFSTSAAMGMQLFTGFVPMQSRQFGATFATDSVRDLITPALTLNRSSRVIPGFLGTPATMTQTSQPSSAFSSSSVSPLFDGWYHSTGTWVSTCDMSAATPGTFARSYSDSFEPAGRYTFSSSDSVCPIPPAAPRTVTLNGRSTSFTAAMPTPPIRPCAGLPTFEP